MTKPRILIAAVSCLNYEERRERCMRTWIPDALHAGLDVVFVVGGGVDLATRDGLMLTLPCADDYDSLPQKTCGLLQWAISTAEYEFIFKCDDDTYLRPERLIAEATHGVDYMGAYWTENAGYASGGAGYLLSRHAAEIAACGLAKHPTGAEDLLVGQILRGAGVPMITSDRFVPFADEQKRPKPTNQIISAHASDPPWKSHRVDFMGEPPIVSANPIGRLGNKMFQVAAAIGYAAKHPSHQPVMSLNHMPEFPGPVFRSLHFAHIPSEAMVIGDAHDFTHREPEYWASRSVKFNGHMQSEKYFSHCRDRIRQAFAAKGSILAKLLSRYRHLLGDSSVSLHVRRGDHIAKSEYHPLQSTQYYREAIKYLDRCVNIRTIVCCTDDPKWCRDVLAKLDGRIQVIEGNRDYEDLWLMSLCSHHIIANSTFSWWSAWLGEQSSKLPRVIIAPQQWFGPLYSHLSTRDIVPDSWVRL